MSESTPPAPNEEFSRLVSDALNQLYDSVALQFHPLGKALFPNESNPLRRCQALRKTLLDAIHALEPGPGVPGSAPDRRLYRLIELRYIEGLDPNEAMSRLALAKSQFYRDQSRVLEMLVETVWSAVHFTPFQTQPADPRSQLIHAEVERLSPIHDGEGIDAIALAEDLSQIISPLAEDRQVRIGTFTLDALNEMTLDRVLLRQAILTAMIAAFDLPGLDSINLTSQRTFESRSLCVVAAVENAASGLLAIPQESLDTCHLLAQALGGFLQTTPGASQVIFSLTWLDHQKRQLLVIDDNTGMADLFRVYLKTTNWGVLSAPGGREAREILRETRPDLIMLDILMPQEDGWELLRAFKNDPGSKDIPIIICSVLKQPQIALKLGASAYVEKPVSQQNLLRALEQVNQSDPA